MADTTAIVLPQEADMSLYVWDKKTNVYRKLSDTQIAAITRSNDRRNLRIAAWRMSTRVKGLAGWLENVRKHGGIHSTGDALVINPTNVENLRKLAEELLQAAEDAK